eukprot:7053-Eustigmatos_ZCMA.PRE.1
MQSARPSPPTSTFASPSTIWGPATCAARVSHSAPRVSGSRRLGRRLQSGPPRHLAQRSLG